MVDQELKRLGVVAGDCHLQRGASVAVALTTAHLGVDVAASLEQQVHDR